MRETKLIELLNGLTDDELIELGDFVRSRIFNSSKNVISLYKYLRKNIRNINRNSITKEAIYRHIFKNKTFNESKYWKLSSAFSAVIDKFLIYKGYNEDIFYKKNLLLESYRKRNISHQFSILSKEFIEDSGKEFNKSINYFINQTHFYFQKLSYADKFTAELFFEDTKNLFENLRMFFIMTHIVSISIISNFDKNFIKYCRTNLWMFDGIMQYLDKNKKFIKKNYLHVYIFYLILYTKIIPENDKYYNELKSHVLKFASLFSGNFLRHILINMLDYAVLKLKSGDEKYLKEIFIINKILADKSLTLFGEYINNEYFYSVVEHAAELNEVVWINDFIDKYKMYLRGNSRDTVIYLSLSKVHFAKKDFDSSLKYLLKVNNISPYFYISQKILLLQNYYERKDILSVKHVLDTLNKYLKRRKDIPQDTEKKCNKFINYYKKLLIMKKNNKEIKALEQLKKEKYFLCKPWLIDKMEYLIEK